MIKSMTGFGRGEFTGAKKKTIAEIKSVNHRYNEVVIRIPRQYALLEEHIKRFILGHVSRGRIEVYLKIEDTGDSRHQVKVDKDLALAYYKALKDLANITETFMDVSLAQIAQMPDVLKIEETEENLDEVLNDVLPAVKEAVAVLVEMRETEGGKLKKDLEEHLAIIGQLREQIEARGPRLVDIYREKLQSRLKELLDNGQVDENRLAMEVAIFADHCSIAEELVRLKSHLSQFAQALEDGVPVGRKLDFLLQEMNREVNTIGSKANDLEITQQVVEMKSELEKLREQVQNIE